MKSILWIVFLILVVGWVLGFLVFKVMGGVIHILLVVAAILLIYNFLTKSRA
ncbi:hypothetical protein SAMN03097699_0305 [Flavobacteriaceae bacterium MAR_2010_188]|nr:hypothetical protein SAMN03097699_0305 [Flavobacteriaceae bacterium MAR_2010_188]